MQSEQRRSVRSTTEARLVACVRDHCRRKGWDIGDLARFANVSRATLYHLEGGKTRRPHGTTLRKIATALGVTPDQLWREEASAVVREPSLESRLRAGLEIADGDRQRSFDRRTNSLVVEIQRESPELFTGWVGDEWDELYSTFGTGGQLTREGVVEAASKINRKRETIQQLHVVLETHLGDVAANVIETLYRMVQPVSNPDATDELTALIAQQKNSAEESAES